MFEFVVSISMVIFVYPSMCQYKRVSPIITLSLLLSAFPVEFLVAASPAPPWMSHGGGPKVAGDEDQQPPQWPGYWTQLQILQRLRHCSGIVTAIVETHLKFY